MSKKAAKEVKINPNLSAKRSWLLGDSATVVALLMALAVAVFQELN